MSNGNGNSEPRKHTVSVLVENRFGVLSRVAGILRTADIFRAKVIDVTAVSFILEATGDEMKLEALIELLRPMGIQEIVRTGKVAVARGPKTRVRRAEPPRRAR